MTTTSGVPPVLPTAPNGRVLRRLFLTLFLRGRSSRGLRKESAPKTVGQKLATTLIFYGLFGLFSLAFLRQPVFVLATYLHAMTFLFLGMFVAASTGEVLFNKEEADILLHRPVTPRALLWAKISMLLQVALWLGVAFNLVGFFVGIGAKGGGALFPLAHALSIVLETLFCTGCIVLLYQFCLRWFGRERLDALMTTTQVLVSILFVISSQLMPRMMGSGLGEKLTFSASHWWIALVPPAWFAGLDDAIAGSRAVRSWGLAGLALVATLLVLGLAFGRLARAYTTGLQTLSESRGPKAGRSNRRWVATLVNRPPLRWWLRDPVSRAAFLLTTAYLVRDRETKLRIYPSVAPMLVFPVIFLLQGRGGHSQTGFFGVAFAGGYLGMIPLLGLNLIQYSQQWQAADLFRLTPMVGPASLCHGARRAVLCMLTLPMMIAFGLIVWLLTRDTSRLPLMFPGIIALPIYALIPCLRGKAVPISVPGEEARSAGRGLTMIGVMMVAMALSGLATWAWTTGWFWWFVLVEAIVAVAIYFTLRASVAAVRWPSME